MKDREIEKDCPCTNAECERHGNCVACFDFHKTAANPVTKCKRPELGASKEHIEKVNARLRAAGRIE